MFSTIPQSILDPITDMIDFDGSSTCGDVAATDVECDNNAPKKTIRRPPMNAQQQMQRINEIEESLKAFLPTKHPPPRNPKKRRTKTPEVLPTKTTTPTKTITPTKMTTPPAEEVSEQTLSGDQGVAKLAKTTRAQRMRPHNIPFKVIKLMKSLNDFGSPFEQSLSETVSDAIDELRHMPRTENLVVELQAMEREWKVNNRVSLDKITALLSRNGVVAIGGVEIPDGML